MRRRNKVKETGANLKTRYLVFLLIMGAMFVYLFSGIVELQLQEGETYQEKSESRSTKTIALRGSRGMITDAEAVILAKDEDIYNVTFYRDASEKTYIDFTKSIYETIEIIEGNGNELEVDSVIRRNTETGIWEFAFGTGVSESVLQTRESQWRSNNYLTVGSYPTPASCIKMLKKRYKIYTWGDLGVYTGQQLVDWGLVDEDGVTVGAVYTLTEIQQLGLMNLNNVNQYGFLTDNDLLTLFPKAETASEVTDPQIRNLSVFGEADLQKLGKLNRTTLIAMGIRNAEDLESYGTTSLSELLGKGYMTAEGAANLLATVSEGTITANDRVVYDEESMLKVMAVFSEMQMNLYNSQPIVIAENVPYETVIEIETRSMSLPGMEIAMGTKRVYPRGSLAAQVIGYIGAIPSTSKWIEIKDQGYQYSDDIGLDGIEASMEDWLTQNTDLRQGYRVVERDSVGKITRELSYTEPQDGDNVKLTLIASYQAEAERALAECVEAVREEQETLLMSESWLETNRDIIENRNWTKYPLSLADRAAMMVVDMEGRVLAMANYPTYDLNAMIEGGAESRTILSDERNVLMNYTIQARGTPGSIFKMVSGLGALLEGELYTNETISDGGRFMLVTTVESQAPKCWISEGQRYKHQDQTIIQGLQNSCNYFFYTLGYRLGETRLYQYASEFGLTSKTGLDLPGEERSVVGCQTSLYDPDKAMDEASQDTAVPIIVFNSLKKHLRNCGATYNITYDDERLNKCVKRLMDMAVNVTQSDWLQYMRPILMEELNMTRSMVYTQSIIGDTYNYLNDIKWGNALTVQTAIGQSITVLTPAAVARYVATLGNGGTVYNLMIVDSITSPEGDVISQRTPTVFNVFEGADQYLPYILKGMEGVVDESGTAGKYFRNWKYKNRVCAKTGTAEVTSIDLENNSWFVMLAPYGSETIDGVPVITEEPEIAVVVFIPSGYSGGMGATAAREFVEWYLDQKDLRNSDNVFLPYGNVLAQ